MVKYSICYCQYYATNSVCITPNNNSYTFHVRGMESSKYQSGAMNFTCEPQAAVPLISYGRNYSDGKMARTILLFVQFHLDFAWTIVTP